MSDSQRGSALLATLVFTFVLAVAATQAGLLIVRQGQLNRVAAANQSALALTERFAEEVVGNYAAIIRHDGTINDMLFPSAPLTGSSQDLGCTFTFTALPTQLEAGTVTVDMTESCSHPTPYTRERSLTYRMSPDLRRVVSIIDSHGRAGSDSTTPTPTLTNTPPTISNATSSTFTIHTTVTSNVTGYLRYIVQTSDPDDPLPLRYIGESPIAASGSVTISFVDDFVLRTGDRTIKVYYSPDPLPSNGGMRYTCPHDPDDVCGVTHLHRIGYTPLAGN